MSSAPSFTNSNTDKNVLNYAGLVSNPNAVFYDAAQSNSLNVLKPSYRTSTHNGTIAAIFAGIGGVEFGTGYSNSAHTTVASCQDCHMAPMTGKAGGHTFFAREILTVVMLQVVTRQIRLLQQPHLLATDQKCS